MHIFNLPWGVRHSLNDFCLVQSAAAAVVLERYHPKVFGFWKCHSEMGLIFQRQKDCETLKYYYQNMAKISQKMKKSVVQLAFNPYFGWFQVPEYLILWAQCITNYSAGDDVEIFHFGPSTGFFVSRFSCWLSLWCSKMLSEK